MDGDRINRALTRIEAALARIEDAPGRARANVEPSDLAALQARHDRLRAAVQSSLHELDTLIEGAQG